MVERQKKRVVLKEVRLAGVKYVITGCAATVAESVTFPLDLTKTRLQIQGEIANGGVTAKKRGMLMTASGIVKNEGLTKLWQGLPPAILRHLIYTGSRMGFYEIIREKVLHRDSNGNFPLWKATIGGLTAGSLGQFIASPMDLVKVQMQMEGKRLRDGHPPRVHGVGHALRTIVKAGGIRGLWAGWLPNVQRAALVNMGDLATYDKVKHFILNNTTIPDNWVCHGMASSCSGVIAATLGTPADVVKTRVMNQPRDKQGKGLYYKSSVDCLLKTVRNEGFMSLYKGFIPIWSRMAPWSLTFWITYEEIRRACGISSF